MTALSIQPTFPTFTGADGQPLENGYIWVGTANLNPITNPITVYWDAALSAPATQPIRTLGGYPSNSGTPARMYVNSDYSIQVLDRKGSVVYSAPVATERYGGGIINAADVVYDPAGTGAVATTVQAKLRETVSVADFGALGNGATDDTAAIQAALDATPNYGTLEFVQGKNYKTTSAINIGVTRQNVTIQGNGATITAAHTGAGLVLISTNENYSAHSVYNLNIVGPNVIYPANAGELAGTSTDAGIKLGRGGVTNTPAAYNCHFYNVNVAQFKFGYYLQNAMLCKWFGGHITWNRYGVFVDSGQTNANDFFGVSIRRNTFCGFYSESHIATLSYPTNNKFIGGTFESNMPYNLATGGYPTVLDTSGVGNAVLLAGHDIDWVFEGTYFENHNYSVWLAEALQCQFNSCYFNPGPGTVTGGVRLDSANHRNTFSACMNDTTDGVIIDFNSVATQTFNNFLNNTGFVFDLADLGQFTNIVNNRQNYQSIGTTSGSGMPYNTLFIANKGTRAGRAYLTAAATGVATTLLSASVAGRYDIFATVIANDAATYGSFATVLTDGTSRIVANNAALVVLTLSGTNVQVTQSLGIAIDVKASWTFTPCES